MSLKSLTDHQLDTAASAGFSSVCFLQGADSSLLYIALIQISQRTAVNTEPPQSSFFSLPCDLYSKSTDMYELSKKSEKRKEKTCLKCLYSGLSIFLVKVLLFSFLLLTEITLCLCSQQGELKRRNVYPSLGSGPLRLFFGRYRMNYQIPTRITGVGSCGCSCRSHATSQTCTVNKMVGWTATAFMISIKWQP